jgi:uncharacterized membrane protein YeaQ/YmgE (transglycosylase-associated protein family)
VTVGIVVAIVVSGFLTGALARLAIPGPDPMPIWLTLSIGLVGSIVGAVIGNTISADNGYVISFLSFGIAILLVAAYRHFVQHRPIFGPEALRVPERGLGVAEQREKLRQLGFDPDAMRRDPKQLENLRLEAMLRELHRAGVLDDDELQAKLGRLTTRTGER